MNSPAPSLHRALLLSLPGAALLSLPVGLWLEEALWPGLAAAFLQGRMLFTVLPLGLGVLAAAAVGGSVAAIRETAESARWPLVRVVMLLFNLAAVGGAALALILATWLFDPGRG